MRRAEQHQFTELLLAAATAALLAVPPHAWAARLYDYKLEVTPEEGPVDPAITKRYTPEWAGCQKRAATTSDNATCFEAELRRQDTKLNQTWTATLNRLSLTTHRELRTAQRQWISSRDPFCRNESDGFAGGTIAPVVYVDCLVELTIRRTIWLERLR